MKYSAWLIGIIEIVDAERFPVIADTSLAVFFDLILDSKTSNDLINTLSLGGRERLARVAV